jgi:hypothetical protein
LNKISLSLVAFLATSLYADVSNSELLKRVEQLEAQVSQSGAKSVQVGDSIFGKVQISGDYRFSMDNLQYDLANGGEAKNDDVLTNRFWLTVNYKPNSHIDFKSRLSFNKVFGQSVVKAPGGVAPFDGFDWIASTTNTDDRVRVKYALINYRDDNFLGTGVPWDFGVGRRSTSYNQLANLRDDEPATSPLGHIVSAEFDGGHLGFKLDKLTGVTGMRVKFAAGRGLSYVAPALSPTPDSNWGENINMFDVNFVFYEDSKIHTELQALTATNLVDITNAGYDMQTGAFNPQNFNPMLETLGDLTLANLMTTYKFNLDNNIINKGIVFASYAMSFTNPDSGKQMLGSMDDETGRSIWIGTQFEFPIAGKSKWGFEYNHGSKYWRSFTYAEDTMAGSKLATRGDAWEAYFTKEIMEGLSFQVRYTYMDYDYSGSNGFFGAQTGMPMKISDIKNSPMKNTDIARDIVDSAQDLRVYLRYRF